MEKKTTECNNSFFFFFSIYIGFFPFCFLMLDRLLFSLIFYLCCLFLSVTRFPNTKTQLSDKILISPFGAFRGLWGWLLVFLSSQTYGNCWKVWFKSWLLTKVNQSIKENGRRSGVRPNREIKKDITPWINISKFKRLYLM